VIRPEIPYFWPASTMSPPITVLAITMVATSHNRLGRFDVWLGKDTNPYGAARQPIHGRYALADGGWRDRVWGIRANASARSHAELDEAEELDSGDPDELASHYPALRERLPNLRVAGGCCGTDDRHIAAICAVLT